MYFETWEDFLDEWGQPDDSNFAVCASHADKKLGYDWSITIYQPRRNTSQEIHIKSANSKQFYAWLNKSVVCLKRSLKG